MYKRQALHTNDKYSYIRDQQLAARGRADYLLPNVQPPLLKPQPEVKAQGTILNVQPEVKVESAPPLAPVVEAEAGFSNK